MLKLTIKLYDPNSLSYRVS